MSILFIGDSPIREYENLVLACMGDSLISVNDGQAPEFTNWVSLTESHTGIRTINAGVSGNTTLQMITRFQQDIIQKNPTHCVILGGLNDIFNKISFSITKNNITTMLDACNVNNIIPILISGIPQWDFAWRFTEGPDASMDVSDKNIYPEQSGQMQELRNWMNQYCILNNIELIDLYNTELLKDASANDLSYYYYDREHLNAKGNMVIAKKIIGYLKENVTAKQVGGRDNRVN